MRAGPTFKTAVIAALLVVVAALVAAGCGGSDNNNNKPTASAGAGGGPSEDLIRERSGSDTKFAPPGDKLLDKKKVILKSALGIDLTHSSATLPLHKGKLRGNTVWFVITEASDFGLANDLNVNFSPKLANMGIGCPKCVQDVTITGSPTNKFGDAVVNFQGAPRFRQQRKLSPGPAAGPNAFPPSNAHPGATGDPFYSPFIKIKGSNVVYNAPIIAVGDRNFDVDTHTNTADRVLSIKLPKPASATPSGRSLPGSVELLLVHGREAGQEIFYLSTEASDSVAATLERATFVPALQRAPFLGGDDTLGSARERIFIFTNGQEGPDNPESQGLSHLIADGASSEDASLKNKSLLGALANKSGDAQNVLGDFPSLADPRHANAYSPLWDAQVGEWTKKAVAAKLNKRQDDENEILNLAATRPDLLRGPAGSPYGSGGFVINCPTIGFTGSEPVIDKVKPVPGSQG